MRTEFMRFILLAVHSIRCERNPRPEVTDNLALGWTKFREKVEHNCSEISPNKEICSSHAIASGPMFTNFKNKNIQKEPLILTGGFQCTRSSTLL